MKTACRALVLAGLLIFSLIGRGEPWLATRFAQNCSACHAPGRVNVPPANRRCTLSCQGCHTNPNGGGLRSQYGKWNQERWLNSMYFKSYKLNKPRPMPTKDQFYADDKIKVLATDKEKEKKVAAAGYRLRETDSILSESEYDRHSTHERFVEPDPQLALARIPDGDPWRIRRNEFFNAGIDSRYFYLDATSNVSGTSVKLSNAFSMANDVSASVEPFQGLTGVVEARFLNGPTQPAFETGFESESRVRSAYVMIDDLPYNSFVMYGIYRPMFGNYTPDHTSLFDKATGLDQRATYRALSFGTAPNVPFLNLHYIEPMNLTSFNQDRGYALNLGARFVSYGAYGMFSYWNTKADQQGLVTNKTMSSVTFGATFNRYTMVFDGTRVQRETVNVRKDAGNVLTLENRLRFWRECYLKGIYETLNTARDLTVGSTSAYSLGLNGFLVSSVETEILYRNLTENANGTKTTEKTILAQIHFFF